MSTYRATGRQDCDAEADSEPPISWAKSLFAGFFFWQGRASHWAEADSVGAVKPRDRDLKDQQSQYYSTAGINSEEWEYTTTPLGPTAPDSNASASSIPRPEKTAAAISNFEDYKLEAEICKGYVVHKRKLPTGVWEESIWDDQENIGSKGVASVWRQKKRGGRQLRAVKMIPESCLGSTGSSQELLALVTLKDASLWIYGHLFVRFFGWYSDTRNIFLVMEYMEDGDLDRYIRCDPQKASADAKEITRQILKGLEVLHEKQIYHRDIKPKNILIASLDPIWVKIADFGIAKRTIGTIARTRLGTECYYPPEILGAISQNSKGPKFPAYALDIWSLGSLVHELLTSKTPFLMTIESEDSGDELDEEFGIKAPKKKDLGAERRFDLISCSRYCEGELDFPTAVLEESQVDKEGIAFVKSLLVPNPLDRPTATSALHNPWLKGSEYTSNPLENPQNTTNILRAPSLSRHANDWFENLKMEFSLLGVNLKLRGSKKDILRTQARKADILHFLPTSAKKKIPSLLLEAITKGCKSAFTMLLESPSREPIDRLTKERLFQQLAETEQLDTIKLLLRNKVDIDTLVDNLPVLQWAAKAGHVKTVRVLLENETDVNCTNCQKAFQLAIKFGHIGVVRVFLRKKFNIHTRLGSGNCYTALQTAAGGGHIEIVELLLDLNADVNAGAAGVEGRTALQAAAGGGHVDIVELLLDIDADVDAAAVGEGGRTALQAAAEGGHIDVVELLLENNADVNAAAAKREGRTALQAAAGGGHINIVKLLLDNKASVNGAEVSYSGRTALQAAAEGGYMNIVELLLKNNADVNDPAAPGGRTALRAAAGGGHVDIVKFLLDNNADVNATAPGEEGRTALQVATESGYLEIVQLLLDNKASLGVSAAGYDNTGAESALIPKPHDYKLETEFHDGYVVHKTHKLENFEVSTWEQVKMIGSGRYGSVWLQKKQEDGQLRAVKVLLRQSLKDSGLPPELLACGGYGSVWLQKKQEDRQLRAVKVLLRHSLQDSGLPPELLALVKLKDYDHLFVRLLGWYEDMHSIFIAMEYIEFGDLNGYMRRDPSKAKADAKRITRQILKGLEVLHMKRIFHRKLKPQNILIASLDPIRVKITDFTDLGTSRQTARANTQYGAEDYCAPELLGFIDRKFNSRKFGYALDIWSLGFLLHELLTFETPFTSEDLYDSDESGLEESALSHERNLDMRSFFGYCIDRIEFPDGVLRRSQVDEEGIAFVKRLLIPSPEDRPTATSALQDPWLKEHTCD